MSASPWFTGLVKEDLQHLHGDGSASLVANEDDSIDWSEIFQDDTSDEDALRASVAHLALGDMARPYHFFMLHLTTTESQATNHGADDAWNRANLPANGSTAPWTEFVPQDVDTAAWRGNSFKRAIARIGDQINGLMDSFATDDTVFLIMGDHGHVPPGGAGGASAEVRLVPLFLPLPLPLPLPLSLPLTLALTLPLTRSASCPSSRTSATQAWAPATCRRSVTPSLNSRPRPH